MVFLLILWMIFIFIVTCTEDVHALFGNGDISFTFTWTPDWDNFFQLYPLVDASILELLGHFIMFFVLTCLLMAIFKEYRHVIVAANTYAIFTEILQVFFGRGADIYDVGANVIGIVVAVGVGCLLKELSYEVR
ncbi:VanZ family protein [Virgibacillus sp. CBA3643]|uniref:VanZ family protein n=1 Tax=Virgibacillus sp. CBA3643 TaxID=2942278 RepID=UPI0035A38E83